jgi:hypothetical protein
LTQSNGNGKSEYKPSSGYRHLGADVWAKKDANSEKEQIAYTDELLEELEEDEQSDSDSDNN